MGQQSSTVFFSYASSNIKWYSVTFCKHQVINIIPTLLLNKREKKTTFNKLLLAYHLKLSASVKSVLNLFAFCDEWHHKQSIEINHESKQFNDLLRNWNFYYYFSSTLWNMFVQLWDNDKNNRQTKEEVLFNVLPHGRFQDKYCLKPLITAIWSPQGFECIRQESKVWKSL